MPVGSNTGSTRPPTLPVLTDPESLDTRAAIEQHRWGKGNIAPFVSYIPVITGTSGGFAYGTGAFQLGRYKRIGPEVQIEIEIYFGNPGFVAGGNTVWNISLPVLPFFATSWTQKQIGTVFFNQGVGQIQDLHAAITTAPSARTFQVPISGLGAGQLLTGTIPAKGQGAILEANIRYECMP